jgi:hypothetical protein
VNNIRETEMIETCNLYLFIPFAFYTCETAFQDGRGGSAEARQPVSNDHIYILML